MSSYQKQWAAIRDEVSARADDIDCSEYFAGIGIGGQCQREWMERFYEEGFEQVVTELLEDFRECKALSEDI